MLVTESLLHSPKWERREWTAKMWFIHTMGSLKGNEVRAVIWMNLLKILPQVKEPFTQVLLLYGSIYVKNPERVNLQSQKGG